MKIDLTGVSGCALPQVLLPLNGPGFEEQRAHMLIGVIVRAKSKRVFDHITGNWKVVSGGQTIPPHKINGKYSEGNIVLTHLFQPLNLGIAICEHTQPLKQVPSS